MDASIFADLEKIITSRPMDTESLSLMATALSFAGDIRDSLSIARTAVLTSPTDSMLYMKLGIHLLHLASSAAFEYIVLASEYPKNNMTRALWAKFVKNLLEAGVILRRSLFDMKNIAASDQTVGLSEHSNVYSVLRKYFFVRAVVSSEHHLPPLTAA